MTTRFEQKPLKNQVQQGTTAADLYHFLSYDVSSVCFLVPISIGLAMWRSSIPVALLLLAAQAGLAEDRFLKQEVASRFLSAARTVRIYLPPSYHQEPNRRYPVLYLQDGQNVFSSAGTNICFGWGSREVDKTVDELCRAKKMQEVILVAIDNSSARYAEYCGRHHSAEYQAVWGRSSSLWRRSLNRSRLISGDAHGTRKDSDQSSAGIDALDGSGGRAAGI